MTTMTEAYKFERANMTMVERQILTDVQIKFISQSLQSSQSLQVILAHLRVDFRVVLFIPFSMSY